MNWKEDYELFKDKTITHRYLPLEYLEKALDSYKNSLKEEVLGYSVLKQPIKSYQLGTGTKKILLWSQMHGNESTTTKAVLDLIAYLTSNPLADNILKVCSLYIIPILNPDGAQMFTRVNNNKVDLNRDSQDLSQPESVVLQEFAKKIQPMYCFNLHDQRTIFNVSGSNKPATVSFLSPAQDKERSVTTTRKISMEIIAKMNACLQKEIPGQVGRYDDGFNINCIGDTFQSQGIPTILFESGHFAEDYAREQTRKLMFFSIYTALAYIANTEITGAFYQEYLAIPENAKQFVDVLLHHVVLQKDGVQEKTSVGILYREILVDQRIVFLPVIEKTGDLTGVYGHKTIDLKQKNTEPLDYTISSLELHDYLQKIQ